MTTTSFTPTTDPLACLHESVPSPPPRVLRPINPALLAIARSQCGLVNRRQCERHGVDKDRRRRLVRAGAWRRVTSEVYLALPEVLTPDDWVAHARRRAMVAQLCAVPAAWPSGFSALTLSGMQGAPLRFRPELATLAAARRGTPSLRIRRIAPTRSGHNVSVIDLPTGRVIASPWALAQVAPEVDTVTLVCIIDSGRHLGLLTDADLDLTAELLRGRAGSRRFVTARRLSDPRSESPLETRTRLQCRAHGIPPDDLQHEVRMPSGAFVARCDMVWFLPGGRLLILELDGAHHRRNGQIDRDNQRDNQLTTLGHRVLHKTWEQMRSGDVWQSVASVLAAEGVLRSPLSR